MVFVSSLDLKEFRGLREFKEPLELAKFNILVGRNNSGKSAILHALSLLPYPDQYLPLKISASGEGVPTREIFISSYLLRGGRSSLIYRYSGKAMLNFEIKGNKYSLELGEDPNLFNVTLNNESADYSKVCGHLNISTEDAYNCVAFVPNDDFFIRENLENILSSKGKWELVEKSGAHISVVKNIINESIDEAFTEVIVRYNELYVRKEVGGKPFYVRVRDLGDGVEKIFSVLLWLETCSPELVLWDDFEASAHPTLIKLVLGWLAKKDWQVVIATHSIDVLLRILEIGLESKDCSIVMLKKTADDILLHKKLTLEELEDRVISNQDPRLLPDLLKL
jgi:AAA15 family ATPase/GTPase